MPKLSDCSSSTTSTSSKDSTSSNQHLHFASNIADTGRRSTPKPVVVHNGGGPNYDEKRPAGWDTSRWK
ncbi:hypothetical protein VTN49DRAFT_4839 [Thermomyces lanuginosus]|uniref:uncharacterized protein n=1 Tax=Thermomyces lanuginosus TaxID=5541 RepID=UPI003742DF93